LPFRASQYLILASKARALLHGRLHATTEDVRALALPVLRHRLLTTFHADADGVSADDIVAQLLAAVPPPQDKAVARVT
jgi:MoxR-like ATPase